MKLCYDWPYSPVGRFSDAEAWTGLPHLLLRVLRKPKRKDMKTAAHAVA